MKQMTLGDLLRDEGIARVLGPEETFLDAILALIATMRGEFTGEDVRRSWTGDDPHNPNCWGAVIKSAVSARLIEPTGEYRKPSDPRSHSRKIQVYRPYRRKQSDG